jgi:uncharacterized protein
MKIDKEAVKTIEENPLALATVDKEGNPRATNVAYAKVKDNKIIITNNYMERTLENIKQNPHISIAVYNNKWAGYQIDGTTEYFEKGEWFDFIKSLKENKGEPAKGAIVVNINSIKKTQ